MNRSKNEYEIKMLNEGVVIDTFLLYQFIRRLATPFEKWKAFELGIIDADGKVLRKRNTLKTKEEKDAFGLFDILVLNLKKLLAKLPFGKTRLASFAAALFLIKEHNNPRIVDSEFFVETFLDFVDDIELVEGYGDEIQKLYEQIDADVFKMQLSELVEEPVNNVGGGEIKGVTDEPGLQDTKKKKKKKKKEDEIMRRHPKGGFR